MRAATKDDADLVERLWLEFLNEGTTLYLPTEKTLRTYMNIRDKILSGEISGVVALVDDFAISMVSDPGLSAHFDIRLGKIAQGWGTFVQRRMRGRGVSDAIWSFTTDWLRRTGFDASVGEAAAGNDSAMQSFSRFGGTLMGYSYKLDLR